MHDKLTIQELVSHEEFQWFIRKSKLNKGGDVEDSTKAVHFTIDKQTEL